MHTLYTLEVDFHCITSLDCTKFDCCLLISVIRNSALLITPFHAGFCSENINICLHFFIISQHWDCPYSWNLSTWKGSTCLYGVVSSWLLNYLVMHGAIPSTAMILTYRKTSCISHTKLQNLNVSCILMQLSSLNPLKPGVKLRMKM